MHLFPVAENGSLGAPAAANGRETGDSTGFGTLELWCAPSSFDPRRGAPAGGSCRYSRPPVMASQPPLYDLMLLLSTGADEEQRTKILTDVEGMITGAGGSIERKDDWGQRPMAYRIKHQPDADYHLLQFTSPPTLIETLSHDLRITDGVVRFRVIKNLPGTPPAPESAPPVVATAAAPAAGGIESAPPEIER
jgi:small subunit ribosomal protein S6